MGQGLVRCFSSSLSLLDTEWRVIAAYHKGLTDSVLSQGAEQYNYKFCLCFFSSASISMTSHLDIILS